MSVAGTQYSGELPPRSERHQLGTTDWVLPTSWMDHNAVLRQEKKRKRRYLTSDHFNKLFVHKILHRDTQEHKDTSEKLPIWQEGTEVGTHKRAERDKTREGLPGTREENDALATDNCDELCSQHLSPMKDSIIKKYIKSEKIKMKMLALGLHSRVR